MLRRRFIACGAAGAVLAGCGYLPRKALVPMPTQLDKAGCGTPAKTLLVILPGRGMTVGELHERGFVDATRSFNVDVICADAHLAYYEQRSILERLRADVFTPARQKGYQSIWLAGISMGGLGALLYADAYPLDVAGVLAIAPYLGEPETTIAVAGAGGVARWQAPSPTSPDGTVGFDGWRSAQALTRNNGSSPPKPVYLGYGLSDRFAASNKLLGDALPAAHVFTAPGGHDWNPWLALWPRMLAASELPRC